MSEGTAVVDEDVGRGIGGLQVKFYSLRFNGRVTMDDDAAIEPLSVDIGAPVAEPKHGMIITEWVGGIEVEASMHKDVSIDFKIVVELVHPFDIFRGDIFSMRYPKAIQ